MSKLIKVTQEYLDEVRKDFEEVLTSGKFSDGKITFTKTVGTINRKAKVLFTPDAWRKMQALVSDFDKEVAWHGVAYRGEDDSKDEYYITDILVYPQEVTGATVNTDQEKYEMWLMSHDDDVFNNIRMQGHSHVNMPVTPSGVDTSLYDRILEQLDDEMFYIFMIWNKKKDKTVKIYDLKKNVLFDTADVTVETLPDSEDISDIYNLSEDEVKAVTGFLTKYREKRITDSFIKEAKDMVKDKVYKPTTTYSGGYGGHGYGSTYYGGSYYGSSGYNGTSQVNKDTKPSTTTIKQSDNKKKNGKRKGKRKKDKGNNGYNNACDTQMSIFNGYPYSDGWNDDDINDPFYARGY